MTTWSELSKLRLYVAQYERDNINKNRCIHAAATGPYERYMTTKSKYSRCGCGPVREILTTNRGITTLRRAHPKHVAFRFPGTTQMSRLFEDRT
ncbi:hypothetical protein TcYC6_0020110 [Trypanosoma cruzi]|nr:hypothetical protein TcYC6_0020110 [Trypanosoma cruzi]